MARQEGFEPPTFGSVDRRSNPAELLAHRDWKYTAKRGTGERLAEKPGFEPGNELNTR